MPRPKTALAKIWRNIRTQTVSILHDTFNLPVTTYISKLIQHQMPPQNSKSQRSGAPATVSFFATHLHSAVIAGVSYASFGNLVLNPTSTLLSTLPLLTIAQATYVVLCLDGNGTTKGKRPKLGKKGEQLTAATGISNKLLVHLPDTSPPPFPLYLNEGLVLTVMSRQLSYHYSLPPPQGR